MNVLLPESSHLGRRLLAMRCFRALIAQNDFGWAVAARPLSSQLLLLGVTIAVSAIGMAQPPKAPLSVVVRSSSFSVNSEIELTVSITNNSHAKVWFESCPEPYLVELTDSVGRRIPYKHPVADPAKVLVCGRNVVYTIEPNQSWSTKIPLRPMFDLKVDTYRVRLLWYFPWNVHKTDHGDEWDILTVSSNRATLTVTQ